MTEPRELVIDDQQVSALRLAAAQMKYVRQRPYMAEPGGQTANELRNIASHCDWEAGVAARYIRTSIQALLSHATTLVSQVVSFEENGDEDSKNPTLKRFHDVRWAATQLADAFADLLTETLRVEETEYSWTDEYSTLLAQLGRIEELARGNWERRREAESESNENARVCKERYEAQQQAKREEEKKQDPQLLFKFLIEPPEEQVEFNTDPPELD